MPRHVDASSHEVASWLWPRLRATFPDALGATLMRDHVHVLPPLREHVVEDFMRVLGNCARGPRPVSLLRWVLGDAPSIVSDVKKARRNVRYVALNPVRAELTNDPLCWMWSTHRDIMGAVADPWVTPERLARAVGWPVRRVHEEWHAYVTRDEGKPGTLLPMPFDPGAVGATGEAPLSWIASAAASATRSELADIQRRGPARALYLALAKRAGWRSTSLVGERCGLDDRSVRKAWARVDPNGMDAALLCLGDARLRALPPPRAEYRPFNGTSGGRWAPEGPDFGPAF